MKKSIHWFRQDLRLSDNPALDSAALDGAVICLYILDPSLMNPSHPHSIGKASRWWLASALKTLNEQLSGNLWIIEGSPEEILPKLIFDQGVEAVYWNQCVDPWQRKRDQKIKSLLSSKSVRCHFYNGSLLWNPEQILTNDNLPYQVFTSFYKAARLKAPSPRKPLLPPSALSLVSPPSSHKLSQFYTLMTLSSSQSPFQNLWTPGELFAQERLSHFLDKKITGYATQRDYPATSSGSRLSPYLHFGHLSPNQIWYGALSKGDSPDIECFCKELAWREFAHMLLYFYEDFPHKNLKKDFNAFPWVSNEIALTAWKTGKTGIPLVDAGMRELEQTGFMENRIRMVVGSFLVKNLLIHWTEGERWFWEQLVDADRANNALGWQWVAGCGVDAAPFFRIFNPVIQGQKFDPDGRYTLRFVPELKNLPLPFLFNPWEAPLHTLKAAGIILGETYPSPIVDLTHSRQRALAAFNAMKNASPS